MHSGHLKAACATSAVYKHTKHEVATGDWVHSPWDDGPDYTQGDAPDNLDREGAEHDAQLGQRGLWIAEYAPSRLNDAADQQGGPLAAADGHDALLAQHQPRFSHSAEHGAVIQRVST